jgi:hypothetical protein
MSLMLRDTPLTRVEAKQRLLSASRPDYLPVTLNASTAQKCVSFQ